MGLLDEQLPALKISNSDPAVLGHIDLWYRSWHITLVAGNRKIRLELSEDLLRKAQRCTGEGVTATVRRGLELLTASTAYTELQKLREKVKFSIKLKQLRNDR